MRRTTLCFAWSMPHDSRTASGLSGSRKGCKTSRTSRRRTCRTLVLCRTLAGLFAGCGASVRAPAYGSFLSIMLVITSDGSNPLTRLAHLGLAEIGENLAGGQTSADWAMCGFEFKNSGMHRLSLMTSVMSHPRSLVDGRSRTPSYYSRLCFHLLRIRQRRKVLGSG